MLDLRHLTMMQALRDHGSLAKASEEMHLTASAVSHQLKELENYFGITLVNRRTRPVTFTPAGQEILALADSTVPQINHTKVTLKRLAHGQTGRLKLASECHSCFDWLMPILGEFRADWGEVEIDFATGFEPYPHDMVQSGEVDVLITTSKLLMNGLTYLPLFEYESRLVLAPTHPLAKQSTITPDDLSEQTLIAYPVEADRLDIMEKFMLPANKQFAEIRTTELTAMLIQLVASERGVAGLPDWVVADYEKKGWVISKRLGYDKNGIGCQLYAAVRQDSLALAFMQGCVGLLGRLKDNVK